jgi:hypothetical protein
MRIDYKQAEKVFAVMLERYRKREHPFIDYESDLPQNMVLPEVKADPLRFALHLFFACHYMRGTMISSLAFKLLNDMQLRDPWLFELEVVSHTGHDVLVETLGRYVPWQKEQIAKLWLINAQILLQYWKGDPRQIFRGVKTKEELYRRVMGKKYREYEEVDGKRRPLKARYPGFGGFREKMTSMLAYFLSASNLVPLSKVSAPVDFHHLRIYLATKMIVTDIDLVRYEDINQVGIELAEWLQKRFRLTQVEYGDVVWLWSLRSCRASPHNASEKVELEGRRRVKRVVPVTWTKEQVTRWGKTCGLCAIAGECTSGVPPGPYYTTGKLTKVAKDQPPQATLFDPRELTFDRLPPQNVPVKAETKEVEIVQVQLRFNMD